MEKKQKPEYKFQIIQPNRVTSAKYNYTEIEENLLILCVDAIQKHLSKEKVIDIDLFNQPMIRINYKEITANKNKSHVVKQLDQLRAKTIKYEWYNEQNKAKEEVYTGLFTAIRNIKETDFVECTISQWAIPFLCYWGNIEDGKDNGFTKYLKGVALTLKGEYTKRIYKLCSRWKDKGGFTMSIEKFREWLQLGESYPFLSDLKRWVLDPAKKRIKEKADLYFEYTFEKVGGSKSYNIIHFKVFSKDSQDLTGNISEWYKFVYLFLCRAYPNYKSDKAQKLADRLAQDANDLRTASEKFQRLDDEYTMGTKNDEDIIKLIKYILKTDFDLK